MRKYLSFLLLIVTVAGFIWPALYNGYPLVYSDTGTYIYSGFMKEVPMDRPISYGYFVKQSSLSESLWFTLLVQSIILVSILYYVSKNLWVQNKLTPIQFFAICSGLIALTGVSWYTGMVMADFFSAISFLLFFLLIFIPPQNKYFRLGLIPVYLFISSTHLTNAPAHVFVCLVLLLIKLFSKGGSSFLPPWKSLRMGLLLALANFIFLPLFHFYFYKSFKTNNSGSIFLLARNVENKSLEKMLDECCESEAFVLCPYKDSFPASSPEFLWNSDSPFNKIGAWKSDKQEIQRMNTKIFTTGKYLKIYLNHYFNTLYLQLFMHNIGEELIPFHEDSPPGVEINYHFNKEQNQFLNAKQAKGFWKSKLNNLNYLYEFVFFISILVILLSLFLAKITLPMKAFGLVTLCYWIGNILVVCIASSGSRYNSRIDWLIVFAALLIVFNWQNSTKELPSELPLT